MAHITVLEHAFSMPGPAGGISESAVNLLQRLSFDGEGKMTALKHLTEFIDICNHFRIVCESKICRLFTVTFKRRIRGWFEMLPAKSIHSWKHFMELFIDAHGDYNYQALRYEIGNLRKQEGESTSTFFSRFMSMHFRFHEKDQLSAEEITDLFLYLDSHSTLHDQANNDKLQIDDMHVDGCITSSVNTDSRFNIIGPNSDTKIVEHQQILGSSNIQFQEQKNLNSTLTFKNHSLVQAIVV